MRTTVDGRNPAPVDKYFCPIIYRVSYIPGSGISSINSIRNAVLNVSTKFI